MDKKEKSISEELNDLKVPNKKKSEGNEILEFFVGILLLGVGLFMLSKRVMVHGSWHIWRIGGYDLSSGLITVPLIIGIIWQFCRPKSIIPKIVITLGAIFIVASVIMSIRINFVTTSMFDYIIIIGMAAAGSGLLLKTLFQKRD